MIRYLHNFDRAGAGVLIALCPPANARQLRVLRRYDANFPDDPDNPGVGSVRVTGGDRATSFAIDWQSVIPGVAHYYAPYYLVNGAWARGEERNIVPTVQTQSISRDSIDVIRERVEAGLNVFIDDGQLHHPRGRFDVLLGPPQFESVTFPAVALQTESNEQDEQFIGGFVGETNITDSISRDFRGGFSRYTVQIAIWSLNPDERRLLRHALRDVIVANRDLLELLGIQELEYSLRDDEDFQAYNAPLYRVIATLNYLSPDVIVDDAPTISRVNITTPTDGTDIDTHVSADEL